MIIKTVNTVLLPLRATLWLSGTALSLSWKVSKWTWKSVWGQNKSGKDGDAYWSELPELRKRGCTRHTGGFYIGRMFRSDLYGGLYRVGCERIFTSPEQSVVMVGQAGAGKSQSVIADQRAIKICPEDLRPDFVSIDPVGEIEVASYAKLKKLDYQILRIDLNTPERGLQYIPLWFKPGMANYDYQLSLFGNSIIPPPVKNPENEPHFPRGARAALIGMIAFEQRINPHGCTLEGCMRKLRAKQDRIGEIIDMVRTMDSPLMLNCLEFLTVISPKEYGSFSSTMSTYFTPFLFDGVVDSTKCRVDEDGVVLDPVDFVKIFTGDKKTGIYIRTGNHGLETGPYVRMILSNAVNIKRWLLNQWHEGKDFHLAPGLQRPFKIYGDEMKNLGNATALVVMQDELRKARCRGFYPFLTDADIYNSLAGAKNLLSGSVQILAGSNNDHETLENRSRTLGEETIRTSGESFSRAGSSQSYHDQFRRLYTPDRIRRIPTNKRLVIMGPLQFIPYNPFELPQKKLFGLVRKPLRY